MRQVRLAQLDRAFGYGPKGRGFESSNARLTERSREFPAFCYAQNHPRIEEETAENNTDSI